MRYLLIILGLLITNWTFGQSDFSKITVSTDSTYGYTDKNPLKMKKGNQKKSIGYSIDFIKSLRTEDNQKLELQHRSSLKNPNDSRKGQITNRYTGLPLSGDLGMLDKYFFLTSEKKDTVTIYVDIYNKGELKIPKGLKIQEQ